MKIFITGINGFIGGWLTRCLLERGCAIVGLARNKNKPRNPKVKYYYGDILDFQLIKTILKKETPGQIFHLAGQSSITYSFSHSQETTNTNINGTLNLLEAIYQTQIKTVFLSVGSSAEYGRVGGRDHFLSEEASLDPQSPYAVSKVSQGFLTGLYKKAFGLKTVHIRPFAVIGPGKQTDAVSDFARGIIKIERGRAKYLTVGNINNIRDFIDVRDAVEAILQVIKNPSKYDTYNLCLGKGIQLREILKIFTRLTASKIVVKQRPQKTRTVDDSVLIGNPARLFFLGFKPYYLIEETLRDILQFWRQH